MPIFILSLIIFYTSTIVFSMEKKADRRVLRKRQTEKESDPQRRRPRLKFTTSQPNINLLRQANQEKEKDLNADYFNREGMETDVERGDVGKRISKRGRTESVQYNKLQEKLSSIENRINEMKMNLEKKKNQRDKKEKAKGRWLDKKSSNKMQMIQRKLSSQKREERQRLKNLITQAPQNTQAISYKVDKLGGLVTTVPEFDGHGFDKNPYSPRSCRYYVSETIKGANEPGSIVFDHVKSSIEFIGLFGNIRMPNNEAIKSRMLNLSMKAGLEGRKTVIFDLDQTLIHCNENLEKPHHVQLPIKFPTGEIVQAGINIRPGATDILKEASKRFEVIVFTASHPCYANVVIDHLDPNREYVHHRLFREHCYLVPNGPYVKDLRIINRPMDKMVLVDNAAYSYAFQLDNGIPIIPYYQGQNDYELSALNSFFDKLMFVDDVRDLMKESFKLHRYRNYKSNEVARLVQELYKEE